MGVAEDEREGGEITLETRGARFLEEPPARTTTWKSIAFFYFFITFSFFWTGVCTLPALMWDGIMIETLFPLEVGVKAEVMMQARS